MKILSIRCILGSLGKVLAGKCLKHHFGVNEEQMRLVSSFCSHFSKNFAAHSAGDRDLALESLEVRTAGLVVVLPRRAGCRPFCP